MSEYPWAFQARRERFVARGKAGVGYVLAAAVGAPSRDEVSSHPGRPLAGSSGSGWVMRPGYDSCVRPCALGSHLGNGPKMERECVREHVQLGVRVADSLGGWGGPSEGGEVIH